MASAVEIAAMRQAIILSALGLGTASPNPPVGCVILDRHGQVVGTGFHRRKGEAHAEVNALTAAGAAARGGTAVVTLEPCNHVGVTPACRQALIDSGIARVLIGAMDPTSRGEGGAAVLAAAGVNVELGVLSAEVLTVLGPWLIATARESPYVTLTLAVGADYEDQATVSQLLTLRSSSDVVITDDRIEEGIASGHSDGHFHFDDLQLPAQRCDVWLANAYKLGVRTCLVLGGGPSAEFLLTSHAVDRIVAAIPRRGDGFSRESFMSIIPSAFEITEVTSYDHGLLVKASRVS